MLSLQAQVRRPRPKQLDAELFHARNLNSRNADDASFPLFPHFYLNETDWCTLMASTTSAGDVGPWS